MSTDVKNSAVRYAVVNTIIPYGTVLRSIATIVLADGVYITTEESCSRAIEVHVDKIPKSKHHNSHFINQRNKALAKKVGLAVFVLLSRAGLSPAMTWRYDRLRDDYVVCIYPHTDDDGLEFIADALFWLSNMEMVGTPRRLKLEMRYDEDPDYSYDSESVAKRIDKLVIDKTRVVTEFLKRLGIVYWAQCNKTSSKIKCEILLVGPVESLNKIKKRW
jgi:hypothetical protein